MYYRFIDFFTLSKVLFCTLLLGLLVPDVQAQTQTTNLTVSIASKPNPVGLKISEDGIVEVKGKVIDKIEGIPVINAEISLNSSYSNSIASSNTDSAGHFTFQIPVEYFTSSNYIKASKSGFNRIHENLTPQSYSNLHLQLIQEADIRKEFNDYAINKCRVESGSSYGHQIYKSRTWIFFYKVKRTVLGLFKSKEATE